ncbi:MAG: glycoside hydrolase domain-containing protein, partial [Candidatus Cryptobacteroides sp.]
LYDPANEPDIAYPYLFSYFRGEEWRTQKTVSELLDRYYTVRPDGIPGNDDTGTMSAWAVFSMMGFYPDCPGKPEYTLTAPRFDRVEISLDPSVFGGKTSLIITKKGSGKYISRARMGGRALNGYRIAHSDLIAAGTLSFDCK